MAILTDAQKVEFRRAVAAETVCRWSRPVVDAAFQAIEDTFTGAAIQTALSTAIDTATAPLVLTPQEKRVLVKHWLRQRAERGN